MLPNIAFEIKLAQNLASKDAAWLQELATYRAEAFYSKGPKGLRKAFKLADGRFYDPDPYDSNSHHILAYDEAKSERKLAGAVRLLPLTAPHYDCVAKEIAGTQNFQKLIQYFDPAQQWMEVNRFFVREDYQHHVLGMNLCAAAWWLGHHLGYHLITNGNIKLVESLYKKHLGGVFFPDHSGPYSSEFYNDDEIYILDINKKLASPYLLEQVDYMKKLLANLQLLQSSVPTMTEEVAVST